MQLVVREMHVDEVGLVPAYFHASTPGRLEQLGVDPTRLPSPDAWRQRYVDELARPVSQRSVLLALWELDGAPLGFSTADRIVYGEQAHMHLHILAPDRRGSGLGSRCVRETVQLYLDQLQLKRILCEPNALNVAPNRALQAAGFRYVKTHRTVPGPLNYHQAVTRWVFEPGR